MILRIVSKLRGTEQERDFNEHVESCSWGYEGVNGGFVYSSGNTEGESLLEFSDVMEIVVANNLFKRRDGRLVTCQSDGALSLIIFWLGNQIGSWSGMSTLLQVKNCDAREEFYTNFSQKLEENRLIDVEGNWSLFSVGDFR